jgi:propanol-preferring alcohol dehydrogenase
MKAMVLERPGTELRPTELPDPSPGPGEVLLRVHACGVCRTDLHIVDGDLPALPHAVIPGHEIVGEVLAVGAGAEQIAVGHRVGVPWLGWTCGRCAYCRAGQENLCDAARFTGYQRAGGYAELAVADARYAFPLPPGMDPSHAAPLLCAGLIGYRALRMAGDARRIGIYGFGAAAHILAQVAHWQGRAVFAFTRPGDAEAQAFARELGAVWAGDSQQAPPAPLDAAILFAPVGGLVPTALRHVRKGGIVVCGGIHMSDIPSFPYELLWGERRVVSVANLTRRDGEEFLAIAAAVPVRTTVCRYPLEAANLALSDLRGGRLQGAAVLLPGTSIEDEASPGVR